MEQILSNFHAKSIAWLEQLFTNPAPKNRKKNFNIQEEITLIRLIGALIDLHAGEQIKANKASKDQQVIQKAQKEHYFPLLGIKTEDDYNKIRRQVGGLVELFMELSDHLKYKSITWSEFAQSIILNQILIEKNSEGSSIHTIGVERPTLIALPFADSISRIDSQICCILHSKAHSCLMTLASHDSHIIACDSAAILQKARVPNSHFRDPLKLANNLESNKKQNHPFENVLEKANSEDTQSNTTVFSPNTFRIPYQLATFIPQSVFEASKALGETPTFDSNGVPSSGSIAGSSNGAGNNFTTLHTSNGSQGQLSNDLQNNNSNNNNLAVRTRKQKSPEKLFGSTSPKCTAVTDFLRCTPPSSTIIVAAAVGPTRSIEGNLGRDSFDDNTLVAVEGSGSFLIWVWGAIGLKGKQSLTVGFSCVPTTGDSLTNEWTQVQQARPSHLLDPHACRGLESFKPTNIWYISKNMKWLTTDALGHLKVYDLPVFEKNISQADKIQRSESGVPYCVPVKATAILKNFHTEAVTDIAEVSSGFLLTVSLCGRIASWDTNKWTLVTRVNSIQSSILCCTFSPEASSFAFGGISRVIHVWHADSRALHSLRGVINNHEGSILSMSSKGHCLLSLDSKGTIRISDLRTLTTLHWERAVVKGASIIKILMINPHLSVSFKTAAQRTNDMIKQSKSELLNSRKKISNDEDFSSRDAKAAFNILKPVIIVGGYRLSAYSPDDKLLVLMHAAPFEQSNETGGENNMNKNINKTDQKESNLKDYSQTSLALWDKSNGKVKSSTGAASKKENSDSINSSVESRPDISFQLAEFASSVVRQAAIRLKSSQSLPVSYECLHANFRTWHWATCVLRGGLILSVSPKEVVCARGNPKPLTVNKDLWEAEDTGLKKLGFGSVGRVLLKVGESAATTDLKIQSSSNVEDRNNNAESAGIEEPHEFITAVQLHDSSNVLFLGFSSGRIKLIDCRSGRLIAAVLPLVPQSLWNLRIDDEVSAIEARGGVPVKSKLNRNNTSNVNDESTKAFSSFLNFNEELPENQLQEMTTDQRVSYFEAKCKHDAENLCQMDNTPLLHDRSSTLSNASSSIRNFFASKYSIPGEKATVVGKGLNLSVTGTSLITCISQIPVPESKNKKQKSSHSNKNKTDHNPNSKKDKSSSIPTSPRSQFEIEATDNVSSDVDGMSDVMEEEFSDEERNFKNNMDNIINASKKKQIQLESYYNNTINTASRNDRHFAADASLLTNDSSNTVINSSCETFVLVGCKDGRILVFERDNVDDAKDISNGTSRETFCGNSNGKLLPHFTCVRVWRLRSAPTSISHSIKTSIGNIVAIGLEDGNVELYCLDSNVSKGSIQSVRPTGDVFEALYPQDDAEGVLQAAQSGVYTTPAAKKWMREHAYMMNESKGNSTNDGLSSSLLCFPPVRGTVKSTCLFGAVSFISLTNSKCVHPRRNHAPTSGNLITSTTNPLISSNIPKSNDHFLPSSPSTLEKISSLAPRSTMLNNHADPTHQNNHHLQSQNSLWDTLYVSTFCAATSMFAVWKIELAIDTGTFSKVKLHTYSNCSLLNPFFHLGGGMRFKNLQEMTQKSLDLDLAQPSLSRKASLPEASTASGGGVNLKGKSTVMIEKSASPQVSTPNSPLGIDSSRATNAVVSFNNKVKTRQSSFVSQNDINNKSPSSLSIDNIKLATTTNNIPQSNSQVLSLISSSYPKNIIQIPTDSNEKSSLLLRLSRIEVSEEFKAESMNWRSITAALPGLLIPLPAEVVESPSNIDSIDQRSREITEEAYRTAGMLFFDPILPFEAGNEEDQGVLSSSSDAENFIVDSVIDFSNQSSDVIAASIASNNISKSKQKMRSVLKNPKSLESCSKDFNPNKTDISNKPLIYIPGISILNEDWSGYRLAAAGVSHLSCTSPNFSTSADASASVRKVFASCQSNESIPPVDLFQNFLEKTYERVSSPRTQLDSAPKTDVKDVNSSQNHTNTINHENDEDMSDVIIWRNCWSVYQDRQEELKAKRRCVFELRQSIEAMNMVKSKQAIQNHAMLQLESQPNECSHTTDQPSSKRQNSSKPKPTPKSKLPVLPAFSSALNALSSISNDARSARIHLGHQNGNFLYSCQAQCKSASALDIIDSQKKDNASRAIKSRLMDCIGLPAGSRTFPHSFNKSKSMINVLKAHGVEDDDNERKCDSEDEESQNNFFNSSSNDDDDDKFDENKLDASVEMHNISSMTSGRRRLKAFRLKMQKESIFGKSDSGRHIALYLCKQNGNVSPKRNVPKIVGSPKMKKIQENFLSNNDYYDLNERNISDNSVDFTSKEVSHKNITNEQNEWEINGLKASKSNQNSSRNFHLNLSSLHLGSNPGKQVNNILLSSRSVDESNIDEGLCLSKSDDSADNNNSIKTSHVLSGGQPKKISNIASTVNCRTAASCVEDLNFVHSTKISSKPKYAIPAERLIFVGDSFGYVHVIDIGATCSINSRSEIPPVMAASSSFINFNSSIPNDLNTHSGIENNGGSNNEIKTKLESAMLTLIEKAKYHERKSVVNEVNARASAVLISSYEARISTRARLIRKKKKILQKAENSRKGIRMIESDSESDSSLDDDEEKMLLELMKHNNEDFEDQNDLKMIALLQNQIQAASGNSKGFFDDINEAPSKDLLEVNLVNNSSSTITPSNDGIEEIPQQAYHLAASKTETSTANHEESTQTQVLVNSSGSTPTNLYPTRNLKIASNRLSLSSPSNQSQNKISVPHPSFLIQGNDEIAFLYSFKVGNSSVESINISSGAPITLTVSLANGSIVICSMFGKVFSTLIENGFRQPGGSFVVRDWPPPHVVADRVKTCQISDYVLQKAMLKMNKYVSEEIENLKLKMNHQSDTILNVNNDLSINIPENDNNMDLVDDGASAPARRKNRVLRLSDTISRSCPLLLWKSQIAFPVDHYLHRNVITRRLQLQAEQIALNMPIKPSKKSSKLALTNLKQNDGAQEQISSSHPVLIDDSTNIPNPSLNNKKDKDTTTINSNSVPLPVGLIENKSFSKRNAVSSIDADIKSTSLNGIVWMNEQFNSDASSSIYSCSSVSSSSDTDITENDLKIKNKLKITNPTLLLSSALDNPNDIDPSTLTKEGAPDVFTVDGMSKCSRPMTSQSQLQMSVSPSKVESNSGLGAHSKIHTGHSVDSFLIPLSDRKIIPFTSQLALRRGHGSNNVREGENPPPRAAQPDYLAVLSRRHDQKKGGVTGWLNPDGLDLMRNVISYFMREEKKILKKRQETSLSSAVNEPSDFCNDDTDDYDNYLEDFDDSCEHLRSTKKSSKLPNNKSSNAKLIQVKDHIKRRKSIAILLTSDSNKINDLNLSSIPSPRDDRFDNDPHGNLGASPTPFHDALRSVGLGGLKKRELMRVIDDGIEAVRTFASHQEFLSLLNKYLRADNIPVSELSGLYLNEEDLLSPALSSGKRLVDALKFVFDLQFDPHTNNGVDTLVSDVGNPLFDYFQSGNVRMKQTLSNLHKLQDSVLSQYKSFGADATLASFSVPTNAESSTHILSSTAKTKTGFIHGESNRNAVNYNSLSAAPSVSPSKPSYGVIDAFCDSVPSNPFSVSKIDIVKVLTEANFDPSKLTPYILACAQSIASNNIFDSNSASSIERNQLIQAKEALQLSKSNAPSNVMSRSQSRKQTQLKSPNKEFIPEHEYGTQSSSLSVSRNLLSPISNTIPSPKTNSASINPLSTLLNAEIPNLPLQEGFLSPHIQMFIDGSVISGQMLSDYENLSQSGMDPVKALEVVLSKSLHEKKNDKESNFKVNNDLHEGETGYKQIQKERQELKIDISDSEVNYHDNNSIAKPRNRAEDLEKLNFLLKTLEIDSGQTEQLLMESASNKIPAANKKKPEEEDEEFLMSFKKKNRDQTHTNKSASPVNNNNRNSLDAKDKNEQGQFTAQQLKRAAGLTLVKLCKKKVLSKELLSFVQMKLLFSALTNLAFGDDMQETKENINVKGIGEIDAPKNKSHKEMSGNDGIEKKKKSSSKSSTSPSFQINSIATATHIDDLSYNMAELDMSNPNSYAKSLKDRRAALGRMQSLPILKQIPSVTPSALSPQSRGRNSILSISPQPKFQFSPIDHYSLNANGKKNIVDRTLQRWASNSKILPILNKSSKEKSELQSNNLRHLPNSITFPSITENPVYQNFPSNFESHPNNNLDRTDNGEILIEEKTGDVLLNERIKSILPERLMNKMQISTDLFNLSFKMKYNEDISKEAFLQTKK